MSVLISSARIDSVTIARETSETGPDTVKITGNYSLLKEDGTVFAKQTFNDYNSPVKFDTTAEIAATCKPFHAELAKQIETLLGFSD